MTLKSIILASQTLSLKQPRDSLLARCRKIGDNKEQHLPSIMPGVLSSSALYCLTRTTILWNKYSHQLHFTNKENGLQRHGDQGLRSNGRARCKLRESDSRAWDLNNFAMKASPGLFSCEPFGKKVEIIKKPLLLFLLWRFVWRAELQGDWKENVRVFLRSVGVEILMPCKNPTSLFPVLASHFCGHDQQLVRLANIWQLLLLGFQHLNS